MSYLAILGRQPAISLAELISLYPNQVSQISREVASLSTFPRASRLGGTLKLAEEIAVLPKSNLQEVASALPALISPHLPDGKTAIGLSLYGFNITPKSAFAVTLKLKKNLKAVGKNVRIVPGLTLEAAQILHNRLLTHGSDIVAVATKNECYIGLTKWVQDIDSYSQRDHGRPSRSAKVGMLPPKLAQIMINLAAPSPSGPVLDPFCGTGVVLQEALLMGFPAYGSDIEPKLVAMSEENLNWLTNEFGSLPDYRLSTADATTTKWEQPIGAVVTEGYLGPPLTSSPTSEQLLHLKNNASQLILKFLANLHPQLKPGTSVCLALPAWKTKQSFYKLNVIDQIVGLGYTLKQFLPVQQADLLYARPNQIVGRELVTLIRK